jgi:hypothetical protein
MIVMRSYPAQNRSLWLAWLASAAVGIGWFFIPAYIIQPFKHQTPAGLTVAMALRQRAPWGTLAAALLCLVMALVLWQTANLWRKIVLALIMALVAFSTVMARLNYFEWMFHPVPSAQFVTASESKLDKGEMVMAVRLGTDAHAYPISEMAYHHVFNDVAGSVPVVATY